MLSIPLVVLLFRRLCEICGRLERLAARYQAGRLWRLEPRPRVKSAESRPEVDGVRPKVARLWPGRPGWLLRIAAHRAAVYGWQLRLILEQPEMVAFMEAAPQAARSLRPLCRMLGVETSLLRPRKADVEQVEAVLAPVEKTKRVRKKRAPIDWGRIPLPRGVLSAARRQGYGKIPRD